MKLKSYLPAKQPLVYRTFQYALQTGRLAHAYLLVGEAGTPLKETAIYLAKTLLCDNPSPLADEACRTCSRIDNGEYPDFILVDGSEDKIKKETVSQIVLSFGQTALEKKGIMVYVIHEVENMTPEAINSLLKFLEEPSSTTYAILTTRNEAKVLPTIISRCEKMRLLLEPRKDVIELAECNGVPSEDAEILSYFYNNADLIAEEAESEGYSDAKEAFQKTLEAFAENEDFARYTTQTEIVPKLTSKQAARFYFDMLTLAFEDMAALQRESPIVLSSYAKILASAAKKLPHIDESLLNVMTLRGQIETNINIGLLLLHLITLIYQES